MIDLDRGVTKRIHPHGFGVCMYKDDPGVYYDTSGNKVADEVAKEAGFPVDGYAKERQRREKLAKAMAEINAEFGNIPVGEVISKVGGYAVKHVGGGGFVLVDPDGNTLTKQPMDKNAAIKLARKMAASEASAKSDEGSGQSQKPSQET